MEDCIFCKIINEDIPCEKVYEDDRNFAFMDIKPLNHGHVLVIPKVHHADIFALPEEDNMELFAVVKDIANAVRKATNCDGINIGMNNGSASGQEVFHAHVHIIPRFNGDGLHPWPRKHSSPEELKSIREKIAQHL